MDDFQRFKQQRESAHEERARERVDIVNHTAALAYQYFQALGRGALVADPDNVSGRANSPDSTVFWYATAGSRELDELELREPEKIIQLIREYNPETAFVAVLLYGDGRVEASVKEPNQEPGGLSPPQAYELIGEQRSEPTGPPATVHRISDWGDGAA